MLFTACNSYCFEKHHGRNVRSINGRAKIRPIGYVRIANRSGTVGITETEWISSESERYPWKYYLMDSVTVDMKSFIRLFARIDRKYGPF